jgi:uncharacterized integral membrane protein
MIRILRLLLALVALVVIIAFSVANRTPVDVSFAPFPITVELPLYGAFLWGLVIGVLVGGIGVWLGSFGARRQARRMTNKVSALESQLGAVRQQQERASAERYTAPRPPALAAASR